MWEKIQKLVDRIESRIALWQVFRSAGVIGVAGVSGLLATGVAWINQFGWYGWFTASLIGAVFSSSALALLGYTRRSFAEAKLLNHAADSREFDNVNPLDSEFHKRRISIYQLKHPVHNDIRDKSFTDCELVGPANIMIATKCRLWKLRFYFN